MRKALFIIALCASACAQNAIVPVAPVFLGPAFSPRLGASLTISFCTSTATLSQCTGGSAYAQAYSDSTNSFPINQATNPLKTDALGNPPAFYGAPGQYSYAVSGPGIAAPQGPYQIFVSCIPGTTCVATGANNAFTGNNTHSGTETFTNGISSNSAAIGGALTASGGGALSGGSGWTIAGLGVFDSNCILDGIHNATLAAAVTCAGSSGVIEVTMASVPALTANVTIPAGVTLRFDGPNPITTTGFTLTINGPIVAGNYQIFAGSGTVVLGPNASSWVIPTWFPGATADVQINAAVAAAASGGSINAQVYGPSSQTIAATVTIGSNSGSGKTITLFIDRSTTYTCTITSNTPCVVVDAGSTVIGFGVIANPNAGFVLSGTAAVSNVLLLVGNLASNLTGGFIEGIMARGATGATVSDAICAVRDTDQLIQWMNSSCIANGTTNTVGLKVYADSGSQVTNPVFHNIDADMGGSSGDRPVWIGCASAGSLTNVSCGILYAVNFFGSLAVHPGAGLPMVTISGSNGAGGQNQVDTIGFNGFQIESAHSTDIGIEVDGAQGVHINGLVASSQVAGADMVKITAPSGTSVDGLVATGLSNQGGWTNDVNNVINSRAYANGNFARSSYFFSSANRPNVVFDGAPIALGDNVGNCTASIAGTTYICQDNVVHALRYNSNNQGYQNFPASFILSSSYTNATTSFTTVTGMSWTLTSNVNYLLSCTFVGQGSAVTAGPKFQLTGPASPTLVKLEVDGGSNATAYADGVATGFSTANATLGTLGAATTDFIWHVNASIANGATAGTLALQAAANGTGTLTISGGGCQLQ